MTVSDAIRSRFSVRRYLDRAVEDDKLQRVLEAARLSPSGGNRQQRLYIVVRDAAKRRALVEAANGQAFVAEAPVVIAACGTDPEREMACEVPAYAVDVAIAIDHITLAAVEEGLGSCWIGAFKQQPVRDILGIPETIKVVELLTLGYPAVDPPAEKSRKPLSEMVMYDGWQG